MKREIIGQLLRAAYALLIAFMVGKWALHAAYAKRGYEAVGGEYILILAAFWLAWKVFGIFIKAVEEDRNGSKKRRSRGNIRVRNRRG